MSTFQDRGRSGVAHLGIPPSGPMDLFHASLARQALESVGQDSVPELWLENALVGPSLRFESPMYVAISGADMNPQLNGQPLSHDVPIEVNSGDTLSMSGARTGVFSYLAFSRPLALTSTLGSVATLTAAGLGGVEGRALADGDELHFATDDSASSVSPVAVPASESELYAIEIPQAGDTITLPVRRGPEFDIVDGVTKHLCVDSHALSSSSRIATLLGGMIHKTSLQSQEMKSSGVFPGVVQLNHQGQLMVLMRDGPTTGGYPRVAVMEEPATWQLAQCQPRPDIKICLELVD